jgi:sugar phosphate isomerase/epimerase
MRTGFVSFDREAYSESIVHADELGFDYVELMMDGDAHRDQLERDSDVVTDALATHDVDLLVHLPYPMLIGSPHRHQRTGAVEELKRCIEVAATLGAEKGVLHPDSYAWRRVWDRDELNSMLVPSVRELDEFAAEHEFEICLENHYDDVGSLDVHGFDVILSETDTSMTFDTGHAAISGMTESEMASFLTEHSERVSHLHLNDTRHPDTGYQGKDEHLPLGYGGLDFATALQPVREGIWDGTLSIELDTADFEYLEMSKRRLKRILA